LRRLDAAHLIKEIHVPGGAAELAVGHALKSNLLLKADDAADRLVRGLAQFLGGEAACLMRGACRDELVRAQQAAGMVGAEGRRRARHDPPLWSTRPRSNPAMLLAGTVRSGSVGHARHQSKSRLRHRAAHGAYPFRLGCAAMAGSIAAGIDIETGSALASRLQ